VHASFVAVVAGGGCRLWTEVSGAGPPLVLCHGGPGLWDMFGCLARDLSDLRTVWRWDQRGCGRSAGNGPYTLAQFLADLDAVVDAAGAPVDLLGHSWGAQLALGYALRHPEKVRSLAYVSGTGLSLDAWRPEFYDRNAARLGADLDRIRALEAAGASREATLLRWAADVHDRSRGRAIAEAMATPWFPVNWAAHDGIRADLAEVWDEAAVEEECRHLSLPTLILDGAEDTRPRWAVDSLAAALPDVRRLVLPGVGHLPWLEAPEPSYAALREFL
jgi:proline iminopeptidase